MSRYAFAPASAEEGAVYGACRPCYDGGTVEDWIDYVRGQGIERVCCLLNGGHLSLYDDLLEAYRAAFGEGDVLHVPVPDYGTIGWEALHGNLLPFLEAGADDGRATVVHCSAGSGRTGHVLVGWLVCERGFGLKRAIETVEGTGRRPLEATSREDLRALLSDCL